MSQRHTEPVANGRTLGRASFWVLGFTVTAAMAVVPLAGAPKKAQRQHGSFVTRRSPRIGRSGGCTPRVNASTRKAGSTWTEFDGREFR